MYSDEKRSLQNLRRMTLQGKLIVVASNGDAFADRVGMFGKEENSMPILTSEKASCMRIKMDKNGIAGTGR